MLRNELRNEYMKRSISFDDGFLNNIKNKDAKILEEEKQIGRCTS